MTEKHGGVPLPLGRVHIFYDPKSVPEEAQQPQTQQVALFDAKPNDDYVNGSVLDVNQQFVVYEVKNGLIRILHRQSSVRLLLRAHEGRKVTDISFFQNGDVLGTVGGNVVIWRIFERSQEIVAEKLLEIPDSLPSVSRIIWHPFNPNQFWLVHRNKVNTNVATLVETTRITTVAHPTESHAVCQLHSYDVIMEGAVQISAANITDLGWSGRDTRHVITSHEDGCIKLWDLKTDAVATANGIVPALCKETIQENNPVTRCMFLPHDNVATNYDSSPESTITTAFCTANKGNSCITLWSPFQEGRPPTKIQVFEMNEQNPNYNLGICHGQFILGGEPPAFFLMLSDRNRGRMYVISLKSIWGKCKPERPYVEGFEYLIPFSTKYPTYSWSISATKAENLEESSTHVKIDFDMRFYVMQSKMVQRMSLSHYMCLPPSSTWGTDTPGVRMEQLSQPIKCDGLIHDQEYEEDYELEDEIDDEDENNDTQYFDHDPYTLPEPSETKNLIVEGENPFANWLGAIAAKSTPASTPSDVQESTIVDPPLPPPAPPSALAIGVTTTVPGGLLTAIPPLPGMSTHERPGLLSPMEILSSNNNVESCENPSTQQQQEKAADAQGRRKNKSPRRRGQSPKGKGRDKKAPTFPPGPVPSANGKIAILKRENPPSSPTTVPVPLPVHSSPDFTSIEESLTKVVNSHFKNQEKLIVAEIQRAVKSEIKQTVMPELNKKVTTAIEQSTTKSLQSSIDRFTTKNANTQTERIVNAVTGSIEEPLKEAFIDSMKTMMIPAFEAASREMFSQVASAVDNRIPPLQHNDSLNAKVDALTTMVQALTAEVVQLRKSDRGQSSNNVQSQPSKQVDQMQHMRKEILGALQVRQYEVAFTKALSASSADMAIFVCKAANLEDVLGGDSSALSQPILLCLMQQLGAGLVSSVDSDLQTILVWLQEIALSVDPGDEGIQRHVPSVLQQLHASIIAKMQQGNPTLRRPLQMLLQVVRGMQR